MLFLFIYLENQWTCLSGFLCCLYVICSVAVKLKKCINVCDLMCLSFAVLPSCSINEYVCASGGCVSASLRCDGHDNCPDSSDEVCPSAKPSHTRHKHIRSLHLAECANM